MKCGKAGNPEIRNGRIEHPLAGLVKRALPVFVMALASGGGLLPYYSYMDRGRGTRRILL